MPETEDSQVPTRQSLVHFGAPDDTTPVCALGEDPEGKQTHIEWRNQRLQRYFQLGYEGLGKLDATG